MKDFEKEMKKYFHQREINPSKDAWANMEKRLSDTKKTKSRYTFLWAAAASIVLFIGLWTINKTPEQKNLINIEQNIKIIPETEQKKEIIETKSNQVVSVKPVEKAPTNHFSNKKTLHKQPKNEEIAVVQKQNIIEKINEDTDNTVVLKTQKTETTSEVLAETKPVKIHVNPENLLHHAEIERQVENTYTDGQNFWRKIKTLNASTNIKKHQK